MPPFPRTSPSPPLAGGRQAGDCCYLVATDWSDAHVPLIVARAMARCNTPFRLILAVPHEPGERDVRAATEILRAAGATDLDVRVESFTEAARGSFCEVVVPTGDAAQLLADVVTLTTAVLNWPPTEQAHDIEGGRLQELLERYRPASIREPATPGRSDAVDTRRGGLFGTYIGNSEMLVAMRWGARIVCSSRERSRTPLLVQHGMFEPELVGYLTKTVKQGQVTVDVGANIGLHTVLLAQLVGADGHVHAFEPFPRNLHFLQTNLDVNWVTDRVTVHEMAASDRAGLATMAVSDEWDGLGSLLHDKVEPTPGYTPESTRTIEVHTERLDAIFGTHSQIDILKIDVEGAENRVLEGLGSLLRDSVGQIIFECMPRHMRDEWHGFARRLHELSAQGWRFGAPDAHGNVRWADVDRFTSGAEFRTVIMQRGDAD